MPTDTFSNFTLPLQCSNTAAQPRRVAPRRVAPRRSFQDRGTAGRQQPGHLHLNHPEGTAATYADKTTLLFDTAKI
eukprot:4539221-Amphidinium_carterae.2